MKKLMCVLALFLTASSGFSKCTNSGLTFWPAGETIQENSIFVIDGYATSQDIIKGLGSTYKIYLKSGDQKINLVVQETLEGQFRLTQAILKPEKSLTAGKEYELKIDNLKDKENLLSRYNDNTSKYEKIKWKVQSGTDITVPAWATKPAFSGNIYQEFGCGPEIYANFKFAVTENSEFLIRTTVKNLATGVEATYCIKAGTDNTICVGHSMCSGAFDFVGGIKYEVEFSLLDASGNITKWTGGRISFNKPA